MTFTSTIVTLCSNLDVILRRLRRMTCSSIVTKWLTLAQGFFPSHRVLEARLLIVSCRLLHCGQECIICGQVYPEKKNNKNNFSEKGLVV